MGISNRYKTPLNLLLILMDGFDVLEGLLQTILQFYESGSCSFVYFCSSVGSDQCAWLHLAYKTLAQKSLMSSLAWGSSNFHVLRHHIQVQKIALWRQTMCGSQKRVWRGGRLSQLIREHLWLRIRISFPVLALRIYFFLKSHWVSRWNRSTSSCSFLCSACISVY